MPRPRKTTYALAEDGNGGLGPVAVDSSAGRVPSVPRVQTPTEYEAEAFRALQTITVYDEGWLRLVSHDHGALTYWKFKFSKGKYAGGYVFYRCDDLDLAGAICGLLRKIEAVYAGTLRPTPDHPYE